MAVVHQLVTAQELLNMPDDGYRYELVEGELRRISPASHQHGRIILISARRCISMSRPIM
jgi:hypothetical protein